MHEGGSVLFLVGVGLLGLTPLLFAVAALVRMSRASGEGEGRGRGSRAVAISLLAVGVLGVGGALAVAARFDGGAEHPAEGGHAAMLPRSLAGLPETQLVTGPEAVQQVSALHRGDFSITGAAIARYGGPTGSAQVWVASSTDEAAARAMVQHMAARIAEGGSPFDAPTRLRSERGVWLTRGMGQAHYFFARGTGVWWLSANSDRLGREALGELLQPR